MGVDLSESKNLVEFIREDASLLCAPSIFLCGRESNFVVHNIARFATSFGDVCLLPPCWSIFLFAGTSLFLCGYPPLLLRMTLDSFSLIVMKFLLKYIYFH